MEDNKNKFAIVTGGSKGIGRELVLELGKSGYSVGTIARSKDKLKKLESEFKSLSNQEIIIYTGDLRDKDSVLEFSEVIKKHTKTIDVIMNNAGFNVTGKLLENVDLKLVDDMFKVHIIAPLILYQEFLTLIRAKSGGRIINIISNAVAGYLKESYGPYNITKYAEYGLGKMMQTEATKHDINITNVILGGVETEIRNEPRPEYLKAVEVARVIVQLLKLPNKVYIPEIHLSPKVHV